MKIINLGEGNSIVNQYMAEMRDREYQQNRLLFRNNIMRVGEMMAYEISKTLSYAPRAVETPLGTAEVSVPTDKVVLATIFRAGLPFHTGFLNVFDHAGNAFVSAYREYTDERHTEVGIHVEYLATPSVEGKTLIIVDPMAQAHPRGLRHSRARGHRACEEDFPRRQDDPLVRRHRPGDERTQVHRARLRRRRRPVLRRQGMK